MLVGYYLRWATLMETKRLRDKERERHRKLDPYPYPTTDQIIVFTGRRT